MRVGTYIGGTMLYERLFAEEPLARQWQAFGPDASPIFYSDTQRFLYAAVAGGSGQVRKTSDGGLTWIQEATDTPTSQNYEGLAATDANHAVVGGSNGLIKYTTNGGSTWTTASVNTSQQVDAMAMTNSNVGFAGTGYAAGVSTTTMWPNAMKPRPWSAATHIRPA